MGLPRIRLFSNRNSHEIHVRESRRYKITRHLFRARTRFLSSINSDFKRDRRFCWFARYLHNSGVNTTTPHTKCRAREQFRSSRFFVFLFIRVDIYSCDTRKSNPLTGGHFRIDSVLLFKFNDETFVRSIRV